MNIRIGTKLAITVGIGVVLVAGMIANQQLSNTSVARQLELARDEQFAIAYLLSASVALQRMQVGTREIRLAISEREADQALAGLRGSMDDAVGISRPRYNCAATPKIASGSRASSSWRKTMPPPPR